VQRKPDYPEAHNNLGNALKDQGRLDEAVACYREALRLQPNYAVAHSNLGVALMEQGQLAEAAASYRQAVRLRPGLAQAHFNLGTALLLMGDYERGWPEYEWRLKCQEFALARPFRPRWRGRSGSRPGTARRWEGGPSCCGASRGWATPFSSSAPTMS
jgi:tetratricopeptide (TPR) repeat protein